MFTIDWFPPEYHNGTNVVYPPAEHIYYPGDSILKATNIKLSLELNSPGSLKFVLPDDNPFAHTLGVLEDIIAIRYIPDASQTSKGKVIWKGRIISMSSDVYKSIEYSCEGALNWLNDVIIPGNDLSTGSIMRIEQILKFFVTEYNNDGNTYADGSLGARAIWGSSVDIGDAPDSPIWVVGKENTYSSILYYLNYYITKYLGGFLYLWYDEEKNYIAYQRYPKTDVDKYCRIVFGENLLSFTENIDASEVIAIVESILKVKEKNGDDEEERIYYSGAYDVDAMNRYGNITRYIEFSDILPEQLDVLTENYLNEHKAPSFDINITAIDLAFLQKTEVQNLPYINVGDVVNMIAPLYNLDRSLTCSKIEYDLIHVENTSYSFGKVPLTYTEMQHKKDSSIGVSDITNVM